MATVVTVTGGSREEVERLTAELCEGLGLRPLGSGRPFEQPGRGGTWMTRLAPPQSDGDHGHDVPPQRAAVAPAAT